jgi:tetratricopeptide (TPR) repeat protein
VLLIRALSQGGGVREAILEATRFVEEFPDDAVVRRLRADAFKSNLQMEEAIADLDVLIERSPKDPLLLQAKIDLLGEADRLDEARRVLAAQLEITQASDVVPEVASQFCASAARFEREHGDAGRALELLETCLERDPKDPTLILERVDVLDDEGREAEATDFLIARGKETLTRFRVQYALAKRLAALDREEEAEAVLREAGKNVGGAQPLLALADLRVARRDLAGAAGAVVEAIRSELGRGPGDADFDWKSIPPEALFAFGDVFISAEDYGHAEEIVAVLDEPAYSLLLEGRLALMKREPKRALELYEKAFRLWPANSGARYLAGVAAMKLGEFDRATALYQDALRADPEANDAGLVLGRMQLAQGYPGAAFDTLEVFLRKNEDHPHAIRDFATAAMDAGLFQYAEAARARLAEDIQWVGIAIADHARDLAQARGPEEARKYLESSRELFTSTHFEALWTWVETLNALGRLDEAQKKVEGLHRAKPDAAGYAVVWARVLALRGDWEEAKSVLVPVVAAEPGLVAAQRDLGRVLVALGETDEAIEHFDHADRIDPLDAEAGYLACVAREKRARAGDALACFERFVTRNPWHVEGLYAAARLSRAAGDRGDAPRILALQAHRFVEAAPASILPGLAQMLVEVGEPGAAAEIAARAAAHGGAGPAEAAGSVGAATPKNDGKGGP